jgi:hypothetical protein
MRNAPSPYPFLNVKHYKDDEITDEVIERCYRIAAKVVAVHGNNYLPIFERMKQEKENREKVKVLKKLALNIANDNEHMAKKKSIHHKDTKALFFHKNSLQILCTKKHIRL